MFRIVIIDQRGCGRSLPYACTDDNTTWDLVADIGKKSAKMLGIRKWLVFGGSWGSTLSLAYAETHPERVAGLVLRGIFLCRPSETAWLNEAGGVSQIYPAQWQKFLAPVAEEKRGGLIAAYHEMLFGEDEAGRLKAAKAWADWESYLIRFEPQDVDEDAHQSLAIARLENHYFVNEGWLKGDKAILANTDKNPPYPDHHPYKGATTYAPPCKARGNCRRRFPTPNCAWFRRDIRHLTHRWRKRWSGRWKIWKKWADWS